MTDSLADAIQVAQMENWAPGLKRDYMARFAAGWDLAANGTWLTHDRDAKGMRLTAAAWAREGHPMPEDPDYAEWHRAFYHHEALDSDEDEPDPYPNRAMYQLPAQSGGEQPQFTRHDLSGPYAKLARHITAMHEIIRLAVTDDPYRAKIAEHVRECMELICTQEKWMLNPVAVVNPSPAGRSSGETFRMVDHGSALGSGPSQGRDFLDSDFVRKQREMHDRLRTDDDTAETRVTDR